MTYKKLYLSNSSIQVFQNCPLRFKYQYIDKMKGTNGPPNKHLSFGQSMHAALADYNTLTTETYKTLDNLHNLLRKNWIREGYDSIDEERSLGLKGLDMLTNYYNDPKDQGKQSLIIEDFIKKDLSERCVLCGKLDKAYVQDDDKIEIIDYKTGDSIAPVNLLPLYIYVQLAKEKLGAYPHAASYYYLSQNKKIVTKVTDEFIKESFETINHLHEQIINEKKFESTPTIHCERNCPYFKSCEDAHDKSKIVINDLLKTELINKIKEIF